jgi:hypothetical protein
MHARIGYRNSPQINIGDQNKPQGLRDKKLFVKILAETGILRETGNSAARKRQPCGDGRAHDRVECP